MIDRSAPPPLGAAQRATLPPIHRTTLANGLRTADIHSEGTKQVGTREMGDAVVAAITKKTTKG